MKHNKPLFQGEIEIIQDGWQLPEEKPTYNNMKYIKFKSLWVAALYHCIHNNPDNDVCVRRVYFENKEDCDAYIKHENETRDNHKSLFQFRRKEEVLYCEGFKEF